MNGSFDVTDTQPLDPDRDGENRGDGAPPQVLVLDTDRALFGLLEEWLAPCGLKVVAEADVPTPSPTLDCALVIVDLPSSRDGHRERLQRIAREYPGAPVLALSSHFFPGVERTGAVARGLGVASAMAKPLSRDTLIHAVQSLVSR